MIKGWDDYPPPVRDPASGCLRWQGPHHSAGYGKVARRYAHIVAYEREVGPVPEGHQIDHVRARGCIWRDCVEPAHLEAVTQAENIRRQPNVIDQMSRLVCPQGHPYEGDNLIIRRGRRECRRCRNAQSSKSRTLSRQRKRTQEAS